MFINEVLQFSTLKLKLFSNHREFYDENIFNYCNKLRDISFEILSQYLNPKILKLNQTGMNK